MIQFLQQLLNGLSLGAIYALIALGYTMVYGVLKFINFAHGDVYMIGAFAGMYITPYVWKILPQGADSSRFSWSTAGGAFAVLALSMAVCAVLGVVIERLVYRPLRERPRLTVLITAIGVSIFLEYFGQYLFGANPKLFPEILPDRVIEGLGDDLILSVNQVVVFAVTLLLLAVLCFIVLKTRIGTAMRALSYNPVAASLMGINNDVVIAFTFGLGSALAAAAAVLNAINYPAYSIDPFMGILPGIKAFVAAVLGGIGSLPGAVVGGLILGVLETMVVGYGSPMYRDAIAFAVLIAILLFKPNGLLGRAEKEKV
ncbi:MAG: branched-chain amino acid ABC transporter permease [Chthoniobacteraceae bacterium]|nr:branched-chain amino acid ABC transporter permease [Chthoniobacteraceae bacterium]